MSPDLTDQPIPPTRCPECGGDPAEATHNLEALGYLHDDQVVVCEDCGHQWKCGVPIGEFDRPELAADLECACGHWRLVHRAARTDGGNIALHLKCPECYSFTTTVRQTNERGVTLIGYPHTTGQTEGAEDHAYGDDITK